nr:HNH endonuclease [Nostoc sp. WHI]
MRRCIYCGERKELTKFSLEHIFPQSLGGSSLSNLFKTHHVCRYCNSIIGQWVDGSFIRNWFTQNFKASIANVYIDSQGNCILPLSYMGRVKRFETSEQEICEFWLGPCGDSIYHFHDAFDSRYDTFVGGNPINLKKNPGDVYIIAVPTNPFWQKIVFNSFISHFNKARRFICNAPDENNGEWIFSKSSEKEKAIIKILMEARGTDHEVNNLIDPYSHERFLAKIALGLGFNIFGDKYLETDYAQFLRDILWRKKPNNTSELKRFLGYFDPVGESLKVILPWEGAHTFLIMSIGDYFILCMCIYGKAFLNVVISDERSLWSDHKNYSDGQIFLVVPQLSKALNPISLPIYISHKLQELPAKELQELEALKIDPSTLPPYVNE